VIARALLLVAMVESPAAGDVVRGTVLTTSSRWDGDAIVTEAKVQSGNGIDSVVQLGGVVDGIGTAYSHQPALLRAGDEVALEVASRRTTTGESALVLVDQLPVASFAIPAGGNAAYGVQRTQHTHTPVWRDSGCIDLIYDAGTISTASATAGEFASDRPRSASAHSRSCRCRC
jgi:hypothetical protein